ncbi:MAG: methyltransferase domain-containing protein [Verrucomicrobiales bacterium]|nr:methyltransferase domain-containing protein [Verrucomicrobiales bacterium]
MSHPLATPPHTDPGPILRYRDRQYAAELIATALLHFDLFSWLDEHPGSDTATLCAHFQLAPRPADVLLTLCRANGFLVTDPADRHLLTPLAREHLVRSSPWYLGPYYTPIRDTPIVQGYLRVLRSGKPAQWQAKEDGQDWHASMLSEEFARGFTELMNSRGRALGQALARVIAPALRARTHVLDVGGGSGIYAATLVAAHPHLRATILELPPVDRIAREQIAQHDLADHIEVVAGDMFRDPWPAHADTVLLSNVLHDWDEPEVATLLSKAAAALRPGGLLVIHEAFLEDSKSGPLPVAEYSALLMSITQGKCYSAAEYGRLLGPLGFDVGPCQPTIADRGVMIAVRK